MLRQSQAQTINTLASNAPPMAAAVATNAPLAATETKPPWTFSTPIILAAGFLKLPSLAGAAGAHIHGQVVVGFLVCGVTAYLSVRFLVRYFETRTLTPFAVYCLVVGAASALRFGIG